MLPLFGIFAPEFGKRMAATEAPFKTGFFGGEPDGPSGDTPLSRAEHDAGYLSGKLWEPDPLANAAARPYAFVSRYVP